MNPIDGFRRLVVVSLFLLTGGEMLVAAPLTLGPGEENVLIKNDLFPKLSTYDAAPPRMAVGDFDGNGRDDVALFLQKTIDQGEVILFLNPTPGTADFSQVAATRIVVSPRVANLKMADLNGDANKDLVIGVPPSVSPFKGQIDIVLGNKNPPQNMNLIDNIPDIRIVGKVNSSIGISMAVGDFVGDDAEDLFLGAPGNNGGCLLKGERTLPLGLIDLAVDQSEPWIIGLGLGAEVESGDFNGDNRDDLALSCPSTGEINIYFGRSDWDVLTSTPDLKIVGPSTVFGRPGIVAVESGDLTNDGKDELLVGYGGPNKTPREMVAYLVGLEGANLSSPGSIVDISTPPAPELTRLGLVGAEGVHLCDFDGDGAADFFFHYYTNTLPSPFHVFGLLTSDVGFSLGNFVDSGDDRWSPQWVGYVELSSPGNFNGDVASDLVLYESAAIGPPYGALRFIYGFKPLTNPAVHVRERTPFHPRVTLDLHVDGSPSDVFLTGDVADTFRERWLPYQSSWPVDLSYGEGPKTVHALFRNAVGRQSERATDNVSLVVGSPGTETFTNVLVRGGNARFDCHLTSSGHIKAEVFDREGTFIARLVDEVFGPGVWPVVWDGKNTGGQKVSPGMYIVILTVNGHAGNYKVLVQG